MERMKNMATRVWRGFCRVTCSRVFAAVLMCAVTLSMVMGVSSHTRVYTVTEGDSSRVVITLSDTPYLNLGGSDVIWADTTVEEQPEEDPAWSVEISADGVSTLVQVTDKETTVADAIQQAGVTVGTLDRVSEDQSATVTDGMLVQVDRVAYEEYTVTETIPFKTTYRQTCVIKPGKTKLDVAGRNGEKVITYRKSIVNGEVVSVDKVDEEVTKKARNQVYLKGAEYGYAIAKTPANANIKLDSKNQPLNYSRVIYGSVTAYHGDTGGFIHNSETVVDLYMDSVVEMNTFGRRTLNVYVIKEGNGK